MKLRKTIAAVLSVALLAASGMTAMAADTQSSTVMPEKQIHPYTIGVEGTIAEVNVTADANSSVTIKTAGENGQELTLNISKETVLMDTQTGLPTTANSLKKGDKIFAYHNGAMTRSLPPQTHAQAILVNLDEKHAPAHLLTAETVTVNTDGSITILGNNGSVLVTIGKDTPIAPLYTKNIVKNTDIQMGTRVFVWYDIVTLSLPGQAQALKAVVLPNLDKDVTIIREGDVAIGEGKVEDGVAMVPIRLVAEALGFKVTWDGKTETVNLSNGKVKTSIKIGTDSYYMAADNGAIGMSKPTSLGAAAYETKGVSWAPAEMFNLLLEGSPVQLIGNTIQL